LGKSSHAGWRLRRVDEYVLADVARYWGFANAGRFSAVYEGRHGEYPGRRTRRPVRQFVRANV